MKCLKCGNLFDTRKIEEVRRMAKLAGGRAQIHEVCVACNSIHFYGPDGYGGELRLATAAELFKMRMEHPAEMALFDAMHAVERGAGGIRIVAVGTTAREPTDPEAR
jgi:hypothetical protein